MILFFFFLIFDVKQNIFFFEIVNVFVCLFVFQEKGGKFTARYLGIPYSLVLLTSVICHYEGNCKIYCVEHNCFLCMLF